MFDRARKNAPCVLFIDEFDGVGQARSAASSASEENVQTINQLLTELDGFEDNTGACAVHRHPIAPGAMHRYAGELPPWLAQHHARVLASRRAQHHPRTWLRASQSACVRAVSMRASSQHHASAVRILPGWPRAPVPARCMRVCVSALRLRRACVCAPHGCCACVRTAMSSGAAAEGAERPAGRRACACGTQPHICSTHCSTILGRSK
jgi:hypothetical protein